MCVCVLTLKSKKVNWKQDATQKETAEEHGREQDAEGGPDRATGAERARSWARKRAARRRKRPRPDAKGRRRDSDADLFDAPTNPNNKGPRQRPARTTDKDNGQGRQGLGPGPPARAAPPATSDEAEADRLGRRDGEPELTEEP